MRWTACSVAVALAAVPWRAAVAQPAADAAERAKAADRSARAHYEHQEYDAAIADYRAAFAALPEPLFLFDIAQSYRRLRDCDRARAFYRDYLRARPDADNRDKVERFIGEMDACATSPAAPEPDGPAAAPQPVLAAPQAPPPPGPPALEPIGIASVALGAVMLGAAIYFSIDARGDAHQLETACASGCTSAGVESIDRAGHDANRDAILTYALGGAALAAGASMLLWSVLHVPGEPTVSPVPGGATISARLRF